jgi:hypothetical protein
MVGLPSIYKPPNPPTTSQKERDRNQKFLAYFFKKKFFPYEVTHCTCPGPSFFRPDLRPKRGSRCAKRLPAAEKIFFPEDLHCPVDPTLGIFSPTLAACAERTGRRERPRRDLADLSNIASGQA